MRQILILFAFVLFGVTACQQSESDPNAESEGLPTVASPATIQPTPTPSLPPTWTPLAVNTNSGSSAGNGGETAVNGNAPTIKDGATVYTIQPGDSLGEIAKTYNVSVQELADINNIANWNIIEVGDVLIIPE